MANRRKARRRKSVARKATKKITRRKYRRNPGGGKGLIKAMTNKKQIISIASLGVGFIGGIKAQKFINGVELLAPHRRFTGIIPIALGLILAAKSRKEEIKAVGGGLALSGFYDLVTQNIPQIGLSPVEGVDLDDDTYTDGATIDVDGEVIDMNGEEDVVMGEYDMVGEDDSPYAMI